MTSQNVSRLVKKMCNQKIEQSLRVSFLLKYSLWNIVEEFWRIFIGCTVFKMFTSNRNRAWLSSDYRKQTKPWMEKQPFEAVGRCVRQDFQYHLAAVFWNVLLIGICRKILMIIFLSLVSVNKNVQSENGAMSESITYSNTDFETLLKMFQGFS